MNTKQQEGQALVLMLAFTLVLGVSLVYLFNTSQVLAERSQAKVLADHAAYNTAVKQAQLLNANAYMNKAKIANQLATAQAVSVASWANHFEPIPQHTEWMNLVPYVGPEVHRALTDSTRLIASSADGLDIFIQPNNIATYSISEQQNLLNNSAILEISAIPETTIDNSSIGEGFTSQVIPFATQYVTNDIETGSFIKQYQGDSRNLEEGRGRLKDVILASRDDFTRQRREDSVWDISFRLPRQKDFKIKRVGGTELSEDLNQWKGVDTFSMHYKKYSCSWSGCRWKNKEKQTGYGSAVVRNDGGDNDRGNAAGYNDVREENFEASRDSDKFRPNWDARDNSGFFNSSMSETGVPRFWDLMPDVLSTEEPTLPVAIRVTKGAQLLDTTSGKSEFKVGSTLDIVTTGGVSAVSTAEVYFERPLINRQGESTYLNKGRVEKASLLNPYWTVRLSENAGETLVEARGLEALSP